jgi:hypothetical protein
MNNRGFSQIALFIGIGVFLLLVALSSYTQLIKTSIKNAFNKPTPTPIPSTTPYYSTGLTANQQMLLRNKEKIMSDLDLTEEQFEGIVKMASDPEFNY